jgi:prepilin-type N-terminal cleavage/methylation domain-containing protein
MMKFLRRKQVGFSLVEVAIAIVIIGLISSFSLKGKGLIHSAKLNSVMEQVNSFRVSTQIFMDKYGALPGDFSSASEVIDGSLENGRGDGRLSNIRDAKRFWKHLIASDLLSVELINGMPMGKIGGCYSVSSDIKGVNGTWLVLTLGTADNASFKGIISQEDAYLIDKKNDTGNPSTGEIRTLRIADSGVVSIGQKYDLKSKEKDCIIIFKII